MPSRNVLLGVGVAILAGVVGFVRMQFGVGETKKGPWKPLNQPEGVPKVKMGRSYFFLTHHKTGTNLMQRFCNITALRSSGNKDECAFCLRMQPPTAGDKNMSLNCVGDPTPEHGKLRGTIDRFSIVSSIHGREMMYVKKFAPDFRAVHMIRHPVKVAISAHQYNKFVASAAGAKWRWDMSAQDIANATSTREELLIEAKAIQKVLVDMHTTHELVKDDPRVLTLDLEEFENNFDASALKLFNHMFDNPPEDLQEFLTDAIKHDSKRWTKNTHIQATVAPRLMMNRTVVKEEWKLLEEERHPDVMEVARYIALMGYDEKGKRIKPAEKAAATEAGGK